MNKHQLELTGLSENHLTKVSTLGNYKLHKDIVCDLIILKEKVSAQGADLRIVSSFRDFSRQLKIFNDKATGKRTLLDKNGESLEYNSLSKEEILFNILRWSALPGLSRHHYGSDFDIIDQVPLKEAANVDYQVQLTPQETAVNGIFGNIHQILDKILSEDDAKFFRPYEQDLGGVSPEKWHLSHKEVSAQYDSEVTFDFFDRFIHSEHYQSIELVDEIRKHRKIIYDMYITNINRV